MKQKYYIIGKDQSTGAIKFTVTDYLPDANSIRSKWRKDYNDVVILTAQELGTIAKPGWCEIGETIEITSDGNYGHKASRDNTPIGTL